MKILIVNDDGIFAPGIAALTRAVAPGNDVTVVAPTGQRSAYSHSLTIRKPMKCEKVDIGIGGVVAYSLDGTPADCCKLALSVLCPDAELVLSGINAGYNIGTDTAYSGTVAAAMEAALLGYRAIAFSQSFALGDDYSCAAKVAGEVYDKLCDESTSLKTVINVNFPENPQGLRVAHLAQLHYDDLYKIDENGFYTIEGRLLPSEDKESDAWAVQHGYISVTPLRFERTDFDSIEHINCRIDKIKLQNL